MKTGWDEHVVRQASSFHRRFFFLFKIPEKNPANPALLLAGV